MNVVTYFNARKLNNFCLDVDEFLSKESLKISDCPSDILFSSPIDYLTLLQFFPQLRIKQDFEVNGCYFFQKKTDFLFGEIWARNIKENRVNSTHSVNGYNISWPDDAISVFDALEDLIKMEDFMSNSIFSRALEYTKKFSILGEWKNIEIIDIHNIDGFTIGNIDPKLMKLVKKFVSRELYNFKPRVILENGQIKVVFYAYKSYYPASIAQYTDTYKDMRPKFTTERKTLVSIQEGIQI